jgi:hypothetical protein
VVSVRCGELHLEKLARVRLARLPRVRSSEPTGLASTATDPPPEVAEVVSRLQCPGCAHVKAPFRGGLALKVCVLGLVSALGCCFKAWLEGSFLWMCGGAIGVVVMVASFWKGLNASHLIRSSAVELSDEPIPVQQLAGRTCGVCSKRIVMDQDGHWCADCGATVHRKRCAQRHAVTAHSPHSGVGPYRGA